MIDFKPYKHIVKKLSKHISRSKNSPKIKQRKHLKQHSYMYFCTRHVSALRPYQWLQLQLNIHTSPIHKFKTYYR